MKILIVEDDERIANPLAKDLRYQNHTVDLARDGLEGWEYTQAAQYDLILLDLMLPKLDGITLCQKLRQLGNHALILMLTAKDTTEDKIIGLDAGADDYLVKPFKLEELAARIRALSRRLSDIKSLVLEYGNLKLDPSSQKVSYEGNFLELTPKEYQILEYFLRYPSKVLTRSALLDKLWDFEASSSEETIRTHITNLRKKLKTAGSPDNFIETVYGVGYRLKPNNL